MALTRREFLKLCGSSAIAFGISQIFIPDIAKTFANAAEGNPSVIWLQGQSCSGCSVSLLNTVHPSIQEALLDIISLRFHPNVSAATGDTAISILDQAIEEEAGKFILVVEGAIPTALNGETCTIGVKNGKLVPMVEWVKELGSKSKAVLNVGTCSSFGGIPAAPPNPTGAKPTSEILTSKTMINIPGCPPHPDWIVGTIAHVLMYGIPELDSKLRPTLFYGELIHDNCERRKYFDDGEFAKSLSDKGCLYELGCKGPITYSDCPIRSWNNGVNWCIQSGAPCAGCCNSSFPSANGTAFYEKVSDVELPGVRITANKIGGILGVATAAGIAGHGIGRLVTKYRRKDVGEESQEEKQDESEQ